MCLLVVVGKIQMCQNVRWSGRGRDAEIGVLSFVLRGQRVTGNGLGLGEERDYGVLCFQPTANI